MKYLCVYYDSSDNSVSKVDFIDMQEDVIKQRLEQYNSSPNTVHARAKLYDDPLLAAVGEKYKTLEKEYNEKFTEGNIREIFDNIQDSIDSIQHELNKFYD